MKTVQKAAELQYTGRSGTPSIAALAPAEAEGHEGCGREGGGTPELWRARILKREFGSARRCSRLKTRSWPVNENLRQLPLRVAKGVVVLLHFFSTSSPVASALGRPGRRDQTASQIHRKPDRFLIRLLCEFFVLLVLVIGFSGNLEAKEARASC